MEQWKQVLKESRKSIRLAGSLPLFYSVYGADDVDISIHRSIGNAARLKINALMSWIELGKEQWI